MNTPSLWTTTAALELPTGTGLLVAPSRIAKLLLGDPLRSTESLIVGKVAGAALVAIGLNCWFQRQARRNARSTGLLAGLLSYNVAVPIVLVRAARGGTRGVLLWPAVVLHGVLALWCTAALRAR